MIEAAGRRALHGYDAEMRGIQLKVVLQVAAYDDRAAAGTGDLIRGVWAIEITFNHDWACGNGVPLCRHRAVEQSSALRREMFHPVGLTLEELVRRQPGARVLRFGKDAIVA